MILDKMATILFKTEHRWKTDQRATIGIPNALGIPSPTKFKWSKKVQLPNGPLVKL